MIEPSPANDKGGYSWSAFKCEGPRDRPKGVDAIPANESWMEWCCLRSKQRTGRCDGKKCSGLARRRHRARGDGSGRESPSILADEIWAGGDLQPRAGRRRLLRPDQI